MTRALRRYLVPAILPLAAAFGAPAQDSGIERPVLSLSAPLRAALIEEMQQVDANMQRIVAGLPRADWAVLADASRKIAGSFILERKLSVEQRLELRRALSDHFVALDAGFHQAAHRLNAAAREKDAELAAFFTYKLADSCVSCHARYARHRFPGFDSGEPKGQ